MAVFDHAIREDLNKRALRRLAVLRPLKLTITNLSPHHYEELDAVNNPEDPFTGTRKIPFANTIYIEQDDFMETPPPKFFRLKPGGEVRLKYAYIIKCDEVVKDASGKVVELRCTADLDSKSGGPTSSRKIKGTIHWVSAQHAIDVEARLYDRLFTVPEPDAGGDFKAISTRTASKSSPPSANPRWSMPTPTSATNSSASATSPSTPIPTSSPQPPASANWSTAPQPHEGKR
jgi:glutaminyl-tRNA synthetase